MRVNLREQDLNILIDICHQRQQEYSQLKRREKESFWEEIQEEFYCQTGKEFKNCNQRMTALTKQWVNTVLSLARREVSDKSNEWEKLLNLWNKGLNKENQQQTSQQAEKQVQYQEKTLNLQLQTEFTQRFSAQNSNKWAFSDTEIYDEDREDEWENTEGREGRADRADEEDREGRVFTFETMTELSEQRSQRQSLQSEQQGNQGWSRKERSINELVRGRENAGRAEGERNLSLKRKKTNLLEQYMDEWWTEWWADRENVKFTEELNWMSEVQTRTERKIDSLITMLADKNQEREKTEEEN